MFFLQLLGALAHIVFRLVSRGCYLWIARSAQVLVMSHELSAEREMDDYFAKKFNPAVPIFVVGRSYKSNPQCKPEETLYDAWLDCLPALLMQ